MSPNNSKNKLCIYICLFLIKKIKISLYSHIFNVNYKMCVLSIIIKKYKLVYYLYHNLLQYCPRPTSLGEIRRNLRSKLDLQEAVMIIIIVSNVHKIRENIKNISI